MPEGPQPVEDANAQAAGRFLVAMLSSALDVGDVPPPEDRPENPIYFVYPDPPVRDYGGWAGRLAIGGPVYVGSPEWEVLAPRYEGCDLPARVNEEGAGRILIVMRQPNPGNDPHIHATVMAWMGV